MFMCENVGLNPPSVEGILRKHLKYTVCHRETSLFTPNILRHKVYGGQVKSKQEQLLSTVKNRR